MLLALRAIFFSTWHYRQSRWNSHTDLKNALLICHIELFYIQTCMARLDTPERYNLAHLHIHLLTGAIVTSSSMLFDSHLWFYCYGWSMYISQLNIDNRGQIRTTCCHIKEAHHFCFVYLQSSCASGFCQFHRSSCFLLSLRMIYVPKEWCLR